MCEAQMNIFVISQPSFTISLRVRSDFPNPNLKGIPLFQYDCPFLFYGYTKSEIKAKAEGV